MLCSDYSTTLAADRLHCCININLICINIDKVVLKLLNQCVFVSIIPSLGCRG